MTTITKSHQPNGFSLFHHKSFSYYFLDISNRRLLVYFQPLEKIIIIKTDTNTAMERKRFVFISYSKMCIISYKTRNGKVSRLDCAGVIGKHVKGLPSRKRSFSKRLFRLAEFQNAGFSFSYRTKTFLKTEVSKRWGHDSLTN